MKVTQVSEKVLKRLILGVGVLVLGGVGGVLATGGHQPSTATPNVAVVQRADDSGTTTTTVPVPPTTDPTPTTDPAPTSTTEPASTTTTTAPAVAPTTSTTTATVEEPTTTTTTVPTATMPDVMGDSSHDATDALKAAGFDPVNWSCSGGAGVAVQVIGFGAVGTTFTDDAEGITPGESQAGWVYPAGTAVLLIIGPADMTTSSPGWPACQNGTAVLTPAPSPISQ